ncbi:hypothetical protein COCON_G00232500 [Conger conger]|uniref:EGF-like domain-containing protein n=1 Tax=Conger conger TaxID=82655 RepID=A0A9Q1CVJ5_CONCO|nr:hypothetical protein COCON_G00232500 [Conger conger]
MALSDGNSANSEIINLRQSTSGPHSYTVRWSVWNFSSVSSFRVYHQGALFTWRHHGDGPAALQAVQLQGGGFVWGQHGHERHHHPHRHRRTRWPCGAAVLGRAWRSHTGSERGEPVKQGRLEGPLQNGVMSLLPKEQLQYFTSLNHPNIKVTEEVLSWQDPDECGSHSLCINTLDSFTCVCQPGYYDLSPFLTPACHGIPG